MAKTVLNNLTEASPSWLVNLTGILAILTPVLPQIIQTMPGSVSAETKEWLMWLLSAMTAVSASITMFARSSRIMALRTDDQEGTDPDKPRGPK